MNSIDIMSEAAKRKFDAPEGWMAYEFESVAGGILVTGCITRPKKSGKNKGEPLFTMKGKQKVMITREDIDRIKAEALEGGE